MKILVTGHRGFIGRYIYNYLESNGYEVYWYDLGDKLEDIKYDYIVHMVSKALIRLSTEYPYEYYKDGLGFTMKFLELARKNYSRFIFPSSVSILNPTNPYSLGKKNAVEWIKLYSKLYDMDYFILKFYNIYGENARKGAVYLFSKVALNNGTATVYGDGTHVRDYLYVGDVVKFVDNIINNRITPGEYEVGSGTGTSVNELIKLIESTTKKKIEYVKKEYIVEESDNLVAQNAIIKDPLPLKNGIEKVIKCIQNNNSDA